MFESEGIVRQCAICGNDRGNGHFICNECLNKKGEGE